jgi:RNA ligase (TIGR02306 family)
MRHLVTVRRIAEIKPIPDADKICAYRVDGWWVVDGIDKYKVGELVAYAEPDSWIHTDIAPFLSKGREPREFNGIKGERLRTVKLRGQLSQGLLLSLDYVLNFEKSELSNPTAFEHTSVDDFYEGEDITDVLGVVKYEAPIPAQLAGEVKGVFPRIIPKTDQERIQNLITELSIWTTEHDLWEATEKLDGSSMTAYKLYGEVGVCSRNLDLKRNNTNSLWKAAIAQGIDSILANQPTDIALQGELVGEGIQGNPYKIKGQKFFLFDIYDIANGRYYTASERTIFAAKHKIDHVPSVNDTFSLVGEDLDSLLAFAERDGSSLCTTAIREGIVFKRHDGKTSFKVISNLFLIKEK